MMKVVVGLVSFAGVNGLKATAAVQGQDNVLRVADMANGQDGGHGVEDNLDGEPSQPETMLPDIQNGIKNSDRDSFTDFLVFPAHSVQEETVIVDSFLQDIPKGVHSPTFKQRLTTTIDACEQFVTESSDNHMKKNGIFISIFNIPL